MAEEGEKIVKDMHALVLGSNSFSGINMVRHLLKSNFSVVGVSRSDFPLQAFAPISSNEEGFEFLKLDLNQETAKICNLIEERRFDFIFNFASQSMVAESWDNPQHWYQTNVMATTRLYDHIAMSDNRPKKLIHVSTPEVYGSCSGAVKEEQQFNPSTPYAVSRAAADFHLRNLKRSYGLSYLITRASNVYGPFQQLYRLIPKAIHKFANDQSIELHGGGESVRNFIHINDVCDATLLLATNNTNFDEYHISGSEMHSIKEVVDLIAQEMHLPIGTYSKNVGERLGKDRLYYLSSDRIFEEFGWKTKVSLSEGLASTLSWYEDQRDELRGFKSEYIHKR